MLRPFNHISAITSRRAVVVILSIILVLGAITIFSIASSNNQNTQPEEQITTVSDSGEVQGESSSKPISANSPESQNIIESGDGTSTDGTTSYTRTTTSDDQSYHLPLDDNVGNDDAQRTECISDGGTWVSDQNQYTCDYNLGDTDSTSTDSDSTSEDLSYSWQSTFESKPTYTDKSVHKLLDSDGNYICDPNSNPALIEYKQLRTTEKYPADPYFYDTSKCYGYKLMSTKRTGDRYDESTQQYVPVYEYTYNNYDYSPKKFITQNQYILCTETKKEINNSGEVRRSQVINHSLRDTVPSSIGYSGQDGCNFYQNNKDIWKTVILYGNPYTPITYRIHWRTVNYQ